ncbi:MAG TPA: 50S ribosomal protein L35 [Candidatus Binataceae bacterium]|jgi:large subunit ribosomal protein L35|nr:50S ribosomal protein L35 [Candidatus Binataceae bacterium]
MGKLKTNRSAAKRFKVTKTGKIKHKKAYLRHLLSSKKRARKRRLRSAGLLNPTDTRTMRALVPYL